MNVRRSANGMTDVLAKGCKEMLLFSPYYVISFCVNIGIMLLYLHLFQFWLLVYYVCTTSLNIIYLLPIQYI